MIVNRSFAVRALMAGVLCFILAMAWLYLILSWEQWQYVQRITFSTSPYPVSNPFIVADVFWAVTIAIVAGLMLLPVLAGFITAVLLPARKATRTEVFRYSGLAGLTPLVLLSILFWALFVWSLVQTICRGHVISGQIPAYLAGVCVNVVIVMAGTLVSAVTGECVRVLDLKLRGVPAR